MATNTVTTGQQSIPEELMPYFTGVDQAYGILPKAQEIFARDYGSAYGNVLQGQGLEGAGRIAGLSPQEQAAGQQIAAMQQPSQFAAGSGAYAQGLGSLGQASNAFSNIGQVSGPGLSQFQMQAPQNVSAPNINYYQAQSPNDIAAQNLQTFQMGGPRDVYSQGLQTYQMGGPQQFTGENVGQYMSPYAQQVMDVQKQEALRDFGKGLSAQNLGAARQGTYGGARNILANTEMQRNLQTQLGGIQATGMQNAFQNAQQQFNTSQAQQQAAQQANLQAALGVQQFGAGQSLEAQRANQAAQQAAQQANLQSALGVQQLGSSQSLQSQQANQAARQATSLANLQAMLNTQQFGAGQSLEAQRANQAAQQAAGQTNLQALLGVQQLGAGQSLEAQRANQAAQLQAAQGYGQLGQMYGALGQGLGQQGALQQQTDLARATALGAYGGTQRSVAQQQLDAQYQDQMRALSFPEQQLGSFANILRGVPLGDTVGTQATTTPPPSFASQLAGVGLGGLSLFNMLGKPG
jgi:hypothetical protein